MWTTVEGIYRHGTIELVERPPDVEESRVLVTFLRPSDARKLGRQMMFGQFPGARVSSEEDFQIAEWRGEASDDDGDQVRR